MDYAKQSEALNRWVEESIDMLTELVQASSVGEAEAEIATLASFGGEIGTRQAALSSLAEFAQSMRDEGIVTNPYCRFPLSTMQAAMVAVTEAVAARDERLQAVLSAQKEFDAKKKIFADEVSSVAAKVSAEKAEVDALGKSAGTVIVAPTAHSPQCIPPTLPATRPPPSRHHTPRPSTLTLTAEGKPGHLCLYPRASPSPPPPLTVYEVSTTHPYRASTAAPG